MKFDKMEIAEILLTDSPAMREAITALATEGYDVRRPKNNSYQLKIGATLNYYPSTGSILEDGAGGVVSERGLDALLRLLASRQL